MSNLREIFNEWVRANTGILFSPGNPESSDFYFEIWCAGRESIQKTLDSALLRMDRARNILTDGNPRPECNWGMLDTRGLRDEAER